MKTTTKQIAAAPLSLMIFLLSSHIINDQQAMLPTTTATNQPKITASLIKISTNHLRPFLNLERGAAQYRQGSTSS